MSIENKLNDAFIELKSHLMNKNCPQCIVPNTQLKNKIPTQSELFENSSNNICTINNSTIPCKVSTIDDFYNEVNSSRFVVRRIPEQIRDNRYDNLFVNKTFKDGKSCRMRGTNQHIWLNKKKSPPNIGVDSNGYCILRGTHIG